MSDGTGVSSTDKLQLMVVSYIEVETTIDRQSAKYSVQETFRNGMSSLIEGELGRHLPAGTVVTITRTSVCEVRPTIQPSKATRPTSMGD